MEPDMDDKKYINNLSRLSLPSFARNGTCGTHIVEPCADGYNNEGIRSLNMSWQSLMMS